MKRVMASALTLALILGAVGCGEKKDDNASIIGGADGATSIYLAPSAGSDKISENQNDDFLYRFPGKWVAQEDGTSRYVSSTRPLNSWKPYIEAAVGIHNILKFLSFEYTHRFTYVGPDTKRWGFRFYFEATF